MKEQSSVELVMFKGLRGGGVVECTVMFKGL